MELDEFKNMWKSQLAKDIYNNKNTSETIKEIIMRTTDILAELSHTNKHWWKTVKTTMTLLLGILTINVILFLLVPEKFQHIKNAFSYYAIVGSFALITLGLYHFQLRIFDVDISVDLRNAVEKAIRQFNKFYLLYNIIYLILFPALFYFVMEVMLRLFNIDMILDTGLLLSGILTVICLGINHIYYKKKYFERIVKLKSNLKELTEE